VAEKQVVRGARGEKAQRLARVAVGDGDPLPAEHDFAPSLEAHAPHGDHRATQPVFAHHFSKRGIVADGCFGTIITSTESNRLAWNTLRR
jgi:hypothetical protein